MVTTFECKSYSKQELADLYRVKKDKFRRWCHRYNLDFGRRKVLEPVEVQAVLLALGPPTITIQWPASPALTR